MTLSERFDSEVEAIFEQLLEIAFPPGHDDPAARQMWLDRFYAARRREGRIYEGDDDE